MSGWGSGDHSALSVSPSLEYRAWGKRVLRGDLLTQGLCSQHGSRVQAFPHKVSASNHKYESKHQNPTYPVAQYWGPFGQVCIATMTPVEASESQQIGRENITYIARNTQLEARTYRSPLKAQVSFHHSVMLKTAYNGITW